MEIKTLGDAHEYIHSWNLESTPARARRMFKMAEADWRRNASLDRSRGRYDAALEADVIADLFASAQK